MKRKRAPSTDAAAEVSIAGAAAEENPIPEALLAQAKASLNSDRIQKRARCVVCNDECAPASTEGLCWVCRRLKLSAWRDSDSQMPAQE